MHSGTWGDRHGGREVLNTKPVLCHPTVGIPGQVVLL